MEFPYRNFLADFFTTKLSLKWSIRSYLMHLAHQNRSRVLLTKVQIWTWSGSETGSQLASIWIKISAKSTENALVSIVLSVFSSQASYFSTFEHGGCVQDATESRIQDLGHVVWGGAAIQIPRGSEISSFPPPWGDGDRFFVNSFYKKYIWSKNRVEKFISLIPPRSEIKKVS